ncbi:hypothetical protein OOU_Y34scaffold00138g14 [Pyricularia oryzae Y34]|uniref:Uncharacterized protein n=2 Tax=Pyricularia oryzae TaxID=318829 RepID=A0AA97P859_PYRO3|nr:hypothetical protein OOU_Y34scaffold00138g14 [Pyricularia oryzae Y34]
MWLECIFRHLGTVSAIKRSDAKLSATEFHVRRGIRRSR